ncbi:MAG: phage major tail protein, TP901-1 family [Lachnospiraceae bacterium]|nr:phage major tail protein, TP901-1 family [Lachnospiraceae bacterium]
MFDMDLQLFDDPAGESGGGTSGTGTASDSTGNAAEGVQGKQIVYLFRAFEDRATATGAVVAFTTENEHSISADGDSTATKDGALQKPGVVTVEITGTAIVLKGDDTLGEKLREACLKNKLVECWEADLSNPRSEGKYAGTYYQGYLTEWTKTSNAEDYAEYSYTFSANGTGAPDGGVGVTVSAEQQAIASYVFADTTATGA